MKRLAATVLVGFLSGTLLAAERGGLPAPLPVTEDERTATAPSLAGRVASDAVAPVHGLLAGPRPRLSVALLDGSSFGPETEPGSAFSWSLEAWQLNTASLAHIQCSRGTQTLESYLVEDCRFVEQPPPSDAANLVQVRGQWMATPGLSFGAGVFSGTSHSDAQTTIQLFESGADGGLAPVHDDFDGLDVNLSFGVQAGRIGDLLVDLQLARYRRQASSFTRWAGIGEHLGIAPERQYHTAGQLALGWRKGDFSGDVMGSYRELPYWVGGGQAQSLSSFDIEFSWRAPYNASFSVGVSNVLDRLPSAESAGESGFDEPMESIYGRIPYVRYKHDL